jgi:hypothetical protein
LGERVGAAGYAIQMVGGDGTSIFGGRGFQTTSRFRMDFPENTSFISLVPCVRSRAMKSADTSGELAQSRGVGRCVGAPRDPRRLIAVFLFDDAKPELSCFQPTVFLVRRRSIRFFSATRCLRDTRFGEANAIELEDDQLGELGRDVCHRCFCSARAFAYALVYRGLRRTSRNIRKFRCPLGFQRELVGVAGFEPATPTSRTWCATRLRYTPTEGRTYSGDLPKPQAGANGRRRLDFSHAPAVSDSGPRMPRIWTIVGGPNRE